MGRDLDSDDDSRDDGFVTSPIGKPGGNETHDHQKLPGFFLRELNILDETGCDDPNSLIPPTWRRFLKVEEQPREPAAAKKQRLTVTLDGDNSTITFDGTRHAVKHEHALFVDILLKAKTWIFGSEISELAEPNLARPDRVRKAVMKTVRPLAGLIESDPKRGYRLSPELVE